MIDSFEQETIDPKTQENIGKTTVETDHTKTPSEEGIDTNSTLPSDSDILNQQISEWKDKFIRLSAEFDNFRKRTNREKTDLIRYGQEDMLSIILPMVDEIQRSIRAADSATDLDGLKKGLHLMDKNLRANLQKNGVQEIICIGSPLDPNEHDAIASVPSPNPDMKGKILDVIETGFKFQEKVVRVSKVIVGE